MLVSKTASNLGNPFDPQLTAAPTGQELSVGSSRGGVSGSARSKARSRSRPGSMSFAQVGVVLLCGQSPEPGRCSDFTMLSARYTVKSNEPLAAALSSLARPPLPDPSGGPKPTGDSSEGWGGEGRRGLVPLITRA